MTTATATDVCRLEDVPRGGGIAALVGGRQVALLRTADGTVHAVDNRDPFTGANVLARGIVGVHGDTPTVASPLRKQRFALATGACLDDDGVRIAVHDVAVADGRIHVRIAGDPSRARVAGDTSRARVAGDTSRARVAGDTSRARVAGDPHDTAS